MIIWIKGILLPVKSNKMNTSKQPDYRKKTRTLQQTTYKQKTMERILTIKEYKFVKEFIELIRKHGILFSTNQEGKIVVIIHEKEGDNRPDFLTPAIELGDCFDETELYEILNQTNERIKQIAEDYKSEEIFTQHLTKK